MPGFIDASEKGRRMIVISDIHANLRLFKALLDRVDLRPEDMLVLDGDYINRGPESRATLQYLMLLKDRPHTYILKGNIERLGEWYLNRGTPESIIPHLADHRHNLLCEWAFAAGYGHVGYDNLVQMRPVLAEKYAEEAGFIRDLPYALETESCIFVHAGIAPELPWRESSEQTMLKNDPYLARGINPTGKYVVVGHMPVWNVPESGSSNCPVVFEERRIIGIDGGNAVKAFAQLNALIFENGEIIHTFADLSPVIAAKESYVPKEQNEFLKFSWPDYFLEILSVGPEFTRCRIKGTQRTGMVKNEHIGSENGQLCFRTNSTPLLLSCKAGERFYHLDTCGGCLMVKTMSGTMGWLPKGVF